ncbi:MAG: VCBS repeat-containing protein, partial [Planctomycetota bacterium]
MRLSLRGSVAILLTLSVLVGIPLGIVAYESHRTGMTWSQVLGRMTARSGGSQAGTSSGETDSSALPPKGEKIDFLVPRPIGNLFQEPPRISNVQAVDLDRDGLLDVVVCDCQAHTVSWIRQYPRDVFTESVCAADLIAPAHVEAIDFDADGDLDLLVAVLGMLFPNNDRIGSVVVLENNGQTEFQKHVVVERVARVSDVRAGDLDGDGDMDLAVAQFGYDDGQTQWIENLGEWNFKSHVLQSRSGPIHAPIADMDDDGDLDIVVLVSQEWEEIYVFEGDGKGRFKPRQIFASDN